VGVWRDFLLAHDNRREVGLGLLEVALRGEVLVENSENRGRGRV